LFQGAKAWFLEAHALSRGSNSSSASIRSDHSDCFVAEHVSDLRREVSDLPELVERYDRKLWMRS
jgi:hypothetical protein